jgi:RHS repeat-associated protein
MTGGVTSSYVYDGDGNRVKETSGGTTTVYIGAYFEWTGNTATMKSYYYAGGTRVAMRTGTITGTVNYLLGDHLGSTALTLDSSGDRFSTNTELRYSPYGVTRYIAGATPTSFNFTGQRKDSGSGLLFYNARWYDPTIGRFLQADTVVPEPGNPQALNRYTYANNSPLTHIDSDGHIAFVPILIGGLAGGVIGGATYALSAGSSFQLGEMAAALGVGVAGGALIGTGVGIGAGVAMLASIGAGAGVLSGEVGYTVAAGSQFETGEMLVAAGANGVEGALSAVTKSPALKIGLSGAASAAQHTLGEAVSGRTPTADGVAASTLIGLSTGALETGLSGGGGRSLIERHPDAFQGHPAAPVERFRDSLRPMIRKELAWDAAFGWSRSTGTEYAGNKVSGTGVVERAISAAERAARDAVRRVQQTRQQAR